VEVLRKIKAPRQGGIWPPARRMFDCALLCLASGIFRSSL
jgi:hypothetical protein